MGIVSDPDLGSANDDYIGCDTNLQLTYCYNADNDDNEYGLNPPAAGFTLLCGPLNRTINPNVRLRMLTSAFVTKASSGGYPCETRPNGEPYAAYMFLSGYKKDSTCWIDPTFNPPKKTKFCYSGDPETNIGWTENKGHIGNCNHDSTGTIFQPNAPGDRRQFFSSGADNFNIIPGESQKFVIAQLIARGTSNLNSVTRLKQLCDSIRNFYSTNFTIGINSNISEIPKEYKLFQNYPNPFNPKTIIKFQIKDSRFVTLKVYDILGKEITTLINEKQSPGVYEVTFDGSNLPSGVYFYRLITNNFSETKKLILLK